MFRSALPFSPSSSSLAEVGTPPSWEQAVISHNANCSHLETNPSILDLIATLRQGERAKSEVINSFPANASGWDLIETLSIQISQVNLTNILFKELYSPDLHSHAASDVYQTTCSELNFWRHPLIQKVFTYDINAIFTAIPKQDISPISVPLIGNQLLNYSEALLSLPSTYRASLVGKSNFFLISEQILDCVADALRHYGDISGSIDIPEHRDRLTALRFSIAETMGHQCSHYYAEFLKCYDRYQLNRKPAERDIPLFAPQIKDIQTQFSRAFISYLRLREFLNHHPELFSEAPHSDSSHTIDDKVAESRRTAVSIIERTARHHLRSLFQIKIDDHWRDSMLPYIHEICHDYRLIQAEILPENRHIFQKEPFALNPKRSLRVNY